LLATTTCASSLLRDSRGLLSFFAMLVREHVFFYHGPA
jgi:hypothetical protein